MELCIALDMSSSAENLSLAEKLADFGDRLWMKVGFRTYIRDGKAFIDTLKQINPHFRVFLDLKLYDIPNTMADAAAEIAEMGVEMFNIHASAGERAMEEVIMRLEPYGKERPLVLAVTALTSFTPEEFLQIYGNSIDEKAEQFARMSYHAGLDGVVCSVFESKAIKMSTSDSFLTLCPGIRPFGEDSGDQKRVATLGGALEAGVDFAVIGRPVYMEQDPVSKMNRILATIRKNEVEKTKGE